MHPEFHADTVRRLQDLITRETGAPLGASAQAEMAAILREGGSGDGAPSSAPADSGAAAVAAPASVTPREVTALLADLRGFTVLSGSQPAAVVMAALDRCLARLGEVVARYQGSIGRLTSESIMVLFGAPAAREDDVQRALLCAVQMQIAMRDLNLEHLRERLPQVFLGIGVNTGTVAVAERADHAAIGDHVNLASRIEAFSLRGQVLISEATYERAWGFVSASSPMQVHVRGREQPVSLREVVAIASHKLKVPRQEFRRSHRVDARLPCLCQRVQDGAVQPRIVHAAIRDLGYHGLSVEAQEPLEPSAELRLEFDLPLVDCRATDVRVRVITLKQEETSGLWLAGLEFMSLSPESSAAVRRFVQLLVSAR